MLVEFLLLIKYKQWDLKINTDIKNCKIIRVWNKKYLGKNSNTNFTTLINVLIIDNLGHTKLLY